MPSLQQSAVQPSTGMDLTRLNHYLAWLATKLSADDYATATNLLWRAVIPSTRPPPPAKPPPNEGTHNYVRRCPPCGTPSEVQNEF